MRKIIGLDNDHLYQNSMVQGHTIFIRNIKDLNDLEKEFVNNNAKYFQSLDWANVNGKLGKESKILLLSENGKIKNSWLFFLMELNLFGFRYRELRLETEPISYEHVEEMLLYITQYCSENKYDNVLFQINMSNWSIELQSLKVPFSNCSDFGTHIINLKDTLPNICNRMHKKHRTSIRKAIKMRYYVIESKGEEEITNFYHLVNKTYGRSGSYGYSLGYLKTILSSQYSRLFLCYSIENELAAAALIIGDKEQAYYFHGGSITQSNGASNLLHWHIIKQLKHEGYEKYDFGGVSYNPAPGTKSYGIKMFKERFGGEFIHVYRGQIVMNKTKTHLISLIRRMYNESYILKKIFCGRVYY